MQLKRIHIFARELFIMKKLEIEKTKPTFIISVLKVEYQVVLVSSISNFFTNKTSLANKWMSFSSSNSALMLNPSRYLIFICRIWGTIFRGITSVRGCVFDNRVLLPMAFNGQIAQVLLWGWVWVGQLAGQLLLHCTAPQWFQMTKTRQKLDWKIREID